MKELLLARSFVWSQTGHRIHTSFLISGAGVAVGVTFLILTVGVYDSYVEKLETITFSVYPHILVLDGEHNGGKGNSRAPDQVVMSDGERCERICQGQTILNPIAAGESNGDRRASLARLDALNSILNGAQRAAHPAPVILEEDDFSCRFERQGREIDEVRTFRILGIDLAADRLVPQVDLFLPAELLAKLQGDGGMVILSRGLAEGLFGAGEPAGRTVTVELPGSDPISLEVAGAFDLGFHAISENMLVTSLATAQTLLAMEGEASYFGVTLENPYDSGRLLERFRDPLAENSFSTSDWMNVARGDFESIRLFRWILFLVLGMSFVVTGFSIRNTLAILTLERRRQIGILRALGLRDASIRSIFLLIAGAIGVSGSVIGLFVGSLLSLRFGYWLDRKLEGLLPIHGVEMSLHPVAMAQVLMLVLLVCSVTAFLSVRRALDLDPVSCLTAE